MQDLAAHPVVAESIDAVKSNPLGAKSISIAEEGYKSIVAPVASYAERPYAYVAPYVKKADSLAADGLGKVDQTFPIVKQNTNTIKSTLGDLIFYPFALAGNGKEYLLNTYSSEYKKCGGDGYVAGGKAIITTSLITTSDTLQWVSEFFNKKKEEAKGTAKSTTAAIKEKAGK